MESCTSERLVFENIKNLSVLFFSNPLCSHLFSLLWFSMCKGKEGLLWIVFPKCLQDFFFKAFCLAQVLLYSLKFFLVSQILPVLLTLVGKKIFCYPYHKMQIHITCLKIKFQIQITSREYQENQGLLVVTWNNRDSAFYEGLMWQSPHSIRKSLGNCSSATVWRLEKGAKHHVCCAPG